jgi:conjugative transfer region lipoprotein (TIGR03751 family)
MKKATHFLITLAVLISFLLAGCATAGKNALPKGGDMTMAQIYQKETGLSINNNEDQDETQARKKLNYRAYSVSKFSGKKQLFKPLPNPEIAMYVYPHLVQNIDGAQPVPGYTTAFFLYKENHFALPSEEY